MNWLLDHLQLVIAAAGGLAWWLNQRKRAQAEQENGAPPAEATFDDPELAERTRRIREDIQRKIEQRGRAHSQPEWGESAPEVAIPPPLMREPARRPVEPPPLARPAAAHYEAQRTAEILEQQAALSERLHQASEMKAAALRRAQYEDEISDHVPVPSVARSALTDDLRDPAALRRAFILREIIGPPVALR